MGGDLDSVLSALDRRFLLVFGGDCETVDDGFWDESSDCAKEIGDDGLGDLDSILSVFDRRFLLVLGGESGTGDDDFWIDSTGDSGDVSEG